MEHELLIKDLNTHLYLKSEKSRQKRTKLVAYMTDNASVGAKGLCHVKSFEPPCNRHLIRVKINVMSTERQM